MNQSSGLFMLIICCLAAISACSQDKNDTKVDSALPTKTSTIVPVVSTPFTQVSVLPTHLPTSTIVRKKLPTLIPTNPPTMTLTPCIAAQDAGVNTIAYVTSLASLNIVNLDGSGPKELISAVEKFKWSPNSQWLGVLRNGDIWLVSPDGCITRRLTSIGKFGSFVWSPDSEAIAFIQVKSEKSILNVVDIESGQVAPLITLVEVDANWQNDSKLAWSPDGKWIAYAVLRPNIVEVVNLQSKEILQLETACQGGTIYELLWSPKSDRLAILDYGNGRFAHGTTCISTLGGKSYPLTPENDHSTRPYWTPDGEGVYVGTVGYNEADWTTLGWDVNPRAMYYSDEGELIEEIALATPYQAVTLSLSPDGKLLSSFRDDQSGEVEIIETETLSSRVVTENPEQIQVWFGESAVGYKWASDSLHLTIDNSGYDRPFQIFNINNEELKPLTDERNVRNFAPSPK